MISWDIHQDPLNIKRIFIYVVKFSLILQRRNSGSDKSGDLPKGMPPVKSGMRTLRSHSFIHSLINPSFANIKTALPFPKIPLPGEDRGEQEKPPEIKNFL